MEFRPTLSPTGGPQFTSRVWKEFCSTLGAQVSLSSGFHPQTNGQTEHTNQELEMALGCVASTNQTTWSEQLPWIEYAHNSLTSTATGLPLKCPLVISHYCSLPMKVSTLYYLFNIIFVGAGGHGGPPEPLWSAQRTETNVGQTGIRPLLPPTCLDKRYGCRPRFVAIGTESRKLTPNYIGPFVVDSLINPVSG